MIPLTLDEISDAVGGDLRWPDGLAASDPIIDPIMDPVRIDTVSTDSRQAAPGALFVALRGESADGHDFVAAAAEAGASAVLVEREVAADCPAVLVDDTWRAIGALGAEVRRRVDPLVVAVTGSVGKTTTKDLTAAALRAGRTTVAATGSFNNELGVPLTLLATEAGTQALVVEIGSRGIGHIAALTPLVSPDIAIVTAVAGVHLELFGDLDAVAVAKGELVEALEDTGTAVLNGDDPVVTAMAARTTATTLRYGTSGPGLDVVAEQVTLDRLARASFTARTPWGSVAVRLPIAGIHNVGNALAALTAAGVAGVDLAAAADALAAAPISGWRGEVTETGGVVVLNDAYNANPTSVAAALDALAAIERQGSTGGAGRTWAVLGVMAEIGATHDADHAGIGARAASGGIDQLVVVGEAAAAMAAGARDAGMPADRVRHVPDADAALAVVRAELAPGDVVLVKASRVGGLERVAAGLERHLLERDPGDQLGEHLEESTT